MRRVKLALLRSGASRSDADRSRFPPLLDPLVVLCRARPRWGVRRQAAGPLRNMVAQAGLLYVLGGLSIIAIFLFGTLLLLSPYAQYSAVFCAPSTRQMLKGALDRCVELLAVRSTVAPILGLAA
jgi:hypothetical protein